MHAGGPVQGGPCHPLEEVRTGAADQAERCHEQEQAAGHGHRLPHKAGVQRCQRGGVTKLCPRE